MSVEKQLELIDTDHFNIGKGRFVGRQVLGAYHSTPLGQHHAQQPQRYSLWAYDPKAKYHDLGRRVHPLWHGAAVGDRVQHTLGKLATLRKAPLDISPREIVGLLFGAQIHDLGENTHPDFMSLCGGVVGDLPRGRKTPQHRELEKRILTKVLQSAFNYMPDDLLQFAFDIATHEPTVSDSFAAHVLEVSHEGEEETTCLIGGDLGLAALRVDEDPNPRTRALISIGQCVTGPRSSLEASIPDFPLFEGELEGTQSLCEQISAANL
jgi:hypothetical protein